MKKSYLVIALRSRNSFPVPLIITTNIRLALFMVEYTMRCDVDCNYDHIFIHEIVEGVQLLSENRLVVASVKRDLEDAGWLEPTFKDGFDLPLKYTPLLPGELKAPPFKLRVVANTASSEKSLVADVDSLTEARLWKSLLPPEFDAYILDEHYRRLPDELVETAWKS